MKETSSNPLISYGVLLVTLLLGLLPYLLMAAAYGTPNTERWSAYNASSTIMIGLVLSAFGVLFYVVREKCVEVEAIARKVMDVDEFQNKKYVDYILAHYGNVASVVAFVAALVFAVKSNISVVGITLSSFVLGGMLPVIFLLYALVFLKTVFGAIRRHALVWFSLMPMLFLDVTLMTMAIKSVPAV